MQRTLILTASTAAAGLFAIGHGLAQESGAAKMAAGRAASEITCAEIAAMDSATVPGVLYYVAGFREGHLSGMAGGAGQSGAGGASAEVTQGAGSEADQATQAAADATGAEGGQATEMAGDAAGAAAEPADDAAGAPGGITGVPVAGYFEIPVEETIAACQQSPDSPVGDVMEQQRG